MKADWKMKKLEDVCEIINDKPANFSGTKRYYTTRGINNNGNYNYELVDYSTRPGRADLMPKIGDVGFAKMKNTNKVFIINKNLHGHIFSTGFSFLRAKKNILPRYLFLFIASDEFQKFKDDLSGAGIMGSIKKADIGNINIPILSIPKQQRIIAIIDEVFGKLTKAKKNTADNLANARKLFETCLQSFLTKPKNKWKEKKLGEVCKISSKLVDPRESKYINQLHVGAGNIETKTGNLIDLKTAKNEKLKSGKFPFNETMILYSKIRPYLMKVVRPDFEGLCSADIYPLLTIPNQMSRNYLFYLLLTPEFTRYAIQGSARAGMPKVNRPHLFAFKCNVPSLDEQAVIVNRLDAISMETTRLETIYQQKLAELEEFKKAILQKAFSGELAGAQS